MSRYLDMVDDPSHVKKLTLDQLQSLAEEIRQEIGREVDQFLRAIYQDGRKSGRTCCHRLPGSRTYFRNT